MPPERVDYHFNVQAAELALCRRSGDGRPGVDNLSVFFLAQGEQSADAAMARLTTFIRAAKQLSIWPFTTCGSVIRSAPS